MEERKCQSLLGIGLNTLTDELDTVGKIIDGSKQKKDDYREHSLVLFFF